MDNKSLGIILFINLINSPLCDILSNALLRSNAQRLTVVPLLTKLSITFLTENIACEHPRPFLKPNWQSEVSKKRQYLSKIHFSKTFDNIELMDMPRKSSTVIDLLNRAEGFFWYRNGVTGAEA